MVSRGAGAGGHGAGDEDARFHGEGHAQGRDAGPAPEAVQPFQLTSAEVPVEKKHFFALAPVLALTDGPWVYSRREPLGSSLVAIGFGLLAVAVICIVGDQLRAEPLLDSAEKIAGAGAAVLVVCGIVGGIGGSMRTGKLRLAPRGHSIHQAEHAFMGSLENAHSVYAALAGGRIESHRDLRALTGSARRAGAVTVSTFSGDDDDFVVATVHFTRTVADGAGLSGASGPAGAGGPAGEDGPAGEGELAGISGPAGTSGPAGELGIQDAGWARGDEYWIWPPLEISAELASSLLPSEHG